MQWGRSNVKKGVKDKVSQVLDTRVSKILRVSISSAKRYGAFRELDRQSLTVVACTAASHVDVVIRVRGKAGRNVQKLPFALILFPYTILTFVLFCFQ